jgi:hypothetical protein
MMGAKVTPAMAAPLITGAESRHGRGVTTDSSRKSARGRTHIILNCSTLRLVN